jgi:hypothetical protein
VTFVKRRAIERVLVFGQGTRTKGTFIGSPESFVILDTAMHSVPLTSVTEKNQPVFAIASAMPNEISASKDDLDLSCRFCCAPESSDHWHIENGERR